MNPLQISLTGLGIAAMILPRPAVNAQNAVARPNIILILADDMGYSDLGCYGSEIETPNLDRLANHGIKFTQMYNAGRCCPSRASLLTGLYQHQTGVGHMVNDLGNPSYQGYINTQCVTLAEALKSGGYHTYMSGKWHVGSRDETLPRQRGFDRYFGLIDGATSYFERIPYRTNQVAPRMMFDDADYDPPAEGFYFTDAITDYALGFIKEEHADSNPFFLYLAYNAPHWPLHALPEDISKYRGKYMNGWDHFRNERYKRMLKAGVIDASAKLSPRDERVPDWETLTHEDQQMWDLRMAVYAAMVDRMDQNIGRIVQYLEETGQLNNTLIMFLSDNGGCHEATKNVGNYIRTTGETGTRDSFDAYEYPWSNVSNVPFRRHKHWVHEGGVATPFIVFYPDGIKGGQISSNVSHIVDIMPTFLEYAGADYPQNFGGNTILPMEGRSLRGSFEGKTVKRSEPLFWEHQGNRAVRHGNWKLVSAYNPSTRKFEKWELYNMKKDRSELNDLSRKESKRVMKLIASYDTWAERVGVVSKEILDSRN
jgi:arylsulfatase A-like enzyme